MCFTERLARGLCVGMAWNYDRMALTLTHAVTHIAVYSGCVCVCVCVCERGAGGDRGPQRGARGVGPGGEHGDVEGESDELSHVVGVRGGVCVEEGRKCVRV